MADRVGMFGVVVAYYHVEAHPPCVEASARLALSLIVACEEVGSVVLVDGSAVRDEGLAAYCESLGVRYEHCGRSLGFAETYNHGASLLSETWIALMASDVYVFPNTFAAFHDFIVAHAEAPIGCIAPRLTQCDLPLQRFGEGGPSFSTPVVTLNLNVMRRATFERVGGISTAYSGYYNDVAFCMRVADLGLEMVILDHFVHHYGRLTLRHASGVDAAGDWQAFFSDHPKWRGRGLWGFRFDLLIRSRPLRLMYRLASRIRTVAVREWIQQLVFRLLPRFQSIR